MAHENTSAENSLKAVIFDIDSILDTAWVHQTAWKTTIDEFLQTGYNDQPVMTEDEYDRFFVRKPRYERIKNLLESRQITLSYGGDEDSPGQKSIGALENQKAKIFNEILLTAEVKLIDKVIRRITEWKNSGIKTAVVSLDENFRNVSCTEEIRRLFDIMIDATTAKKTGLKDKPEADLFMEAVRQLGLAPEQCAVFDSTVGGLRAASKANFGLVAGIPGDHNNRELNENGADVVIDEFDAFDLLNDQEVQARFRQPFPRFASEYTKIGEIVQGKTPVIFLDFDGTLTPIVKHPEDAYLSDEMQEIIKACAARLKVAVVSGRDMDDLKKRVMLDNVIYAGSHGFRISGPGGLYREHEKTAEILPLLDDTEQKLEQLFSGRFKGVKIERKRYAIAVHFRNAAKEDIPGIREKVFEFVDNTAGLKTGEGKMIIELKPDIEWHKGKAVKWILEKLGMDDRSSYLPVYIGDDVTDEDAYKELADEGISIQVGPGAEPSAARFRLRNIYHVRILLKELAQAGLKS